MCGIAGIIDSTQETPRQIVESMLSNLLHRGPDGKGIERASNCIFGHTRLSIIDLEHGKQPMFNQPRTQMLTFNGEIYGYKEIKKSVSFGYQTTSDTEVILALYDKYGSHFVEHLPGMFALALWDNEKRELLCARDRFGEKPFYYALGKNGEFVFASEIKAIKASGLVDLKIDYQQVAHYLQFLYVDPTKTIFENVHVLEPGHKLIYKDNIVEIAKYWNPPKVNYSMTIEEASEEFERLFQKAIEKQMIADVEVGAFLSGGLDSSTIVALASQINTKLKTFSFGFEGNYSELPYAASVANKYETDHYEFRQEEFNIADLLIKMQHVYDEPLADTAVIPTYLISQYASKTVKVIMAGEGADELLGGYDFWYNRLVDFDNFVATPSTKFRFEKLFHSIRFQLGPYENLRMKSKFRGEALADVYPSLVAFHHENQKYFTDDELSSLGLKAQESDHNSFNRINDALRYDVQRYLPGDILSKADRASMANSLELRAPFLDVDLAEFCLTIPFALNFDGRNNKQVLKRSFSYLWPEEMKNRPKQGFGAPVNRWLSDPDITTLLKDVAHSSRSILNLDKKAVLRFLGEGTYKSWSLLNLFLWEEAASKSKAIA